MNIGLIDMNKKPKGKPFPNLALMKISAYHKSLGDSVEWYEPLKHVRVTTADNEIKLHLYINIASNAKIPVVCSSVQQAVKNAVQSMTGRIVTKVNISIAGIDFNEPTEFQK